MKNRSRKTRAFSLIEIAVALLVFSIGILAILALFPSGVILSQESHAETYVTDFAEMVFNSIAIETERDSRFWSLSSSDFGDMVRTYDFATTEPVYGRWSAPPPPLMFKVRADGEWHTNVYNITVAADVITELALRYKLELATDPRMGLLGQDPRSYGPLLDPTGGVHSIERAVQVGHPNKLYYPASDEIIKATLTVRPGPYGSTERVFRRYYYDWDNIRRN